MRDWLIPSFVPASEREKWHGAIYAMHPDIGPEQVLQCEHEHESMKRATQCAERELWWARRVIALADERRAS